MFSRCHCQFARWIVGKAGIVVLGSFLFIYLCRLSMTLLAYRTVPHYSHSLDLETKMHPYDSSYRDVLRGMNSDDVKSALFSLNDTSIQTIFNQRSHKKAPWVPRLTENDTKGYEIQRITNKPFANIKHAFIDYYTRLGITIMQHNNMDTVQNIIDQGKVSEVKRTSDYTFLDVVYPKFNMTLPNFVSHIDKKIAMKSQYFMKFMERSPDQLKGHIELIVEGVAKETFNCGWQGNLTSWRKKAQR